MNKDIDMKKIRIRFLMIVVILAFSACLVVGGLTIKRHVDMLQDVKNLKTDFLNVVTNQKESGVDYGKLVEWYDIATDYGNIKKVEELDLKFEQVKHDDKSGYAEVRYTYFVRFEDGTSTGAHRVASKWFIRKCKNRWIVYDIEENP